MSVEHYGAELESSTLHCITLDYFFYSECIFFYLRSADMHNACIAGATACSTQVKGMFSIEMYVKWRLTMKLMTDKLQKC